MAAFRYTAGLRGTASGEVDDEEVERRETMKKLRRRPLSETLEQLGEGRGRHCVIFATVIFTDTTRYLRPWIRGEEATKAYGQVWDRCEGSAGLDATGNFLGVQYISRHRISKFEHFPKLVHTTCYYKLENAKLSSSNHIAHKLIASNTRRCPHWQQFQRAIGFSGMQ